MAVLGAVQIPRSNLHCFQEELQLKTMAFLIILIAFLRAESPLAAFVCHQNLYITNELQSSGLEISKVSD